MLTGLLRAWSCKHLLGPRQAQHEQKNLNVSNMCIVYPEPVEGGGAQPLGARRFS